MNVRSVLTAAHQTAETANVQLIVWCGGEKVKVDAEVVRVDPDTGALVLSGYE